MMFRLARSGLVALSALALCMKPYAAIAQSTTATLRGRVTDAATHRAIPDAQVTIAGSRLGASTTADGAFLLSAVPTGARTLEVRRIGYQPTSRALTVNAGDNTVPEIALTVSAVNLSEVVVTGTAAPTEKRKIGTSIASIDSSVIGNAQSVTVDQAMQGKIPGAQITQNSGSPGGGGISVRLRGTNSFISGSDPLYIVDGVIVDNGSAQIADLGIRSNPQNRLADINPSDIDRIEVTRGAAAAALYGSRANNGVVQIFTKRGNIGRPRFTLNTRFSQSELREQQPFNFYPFNENGLPVQRFNYQDDIFHSAPANEQNVTVEGGNDATRYYISGNFADEDGIMRSTSSRRTGARVNLQQQLTSSLIGNVTANYVRTQNEIQAFGEQNDYGIMGSLFFAPTSVDFRPVNGIYPLPPALGTNPLLAIARIRNPQSVNRFIGSTKLTYTPLASMLFDYTIGVDNSTSSRISSFRVTRCSAPRRWRRAGRSRRCRAHSSSTRTPSGRTRGSRSVPSRCARPRARTTRRSVSVRPSRRRTDSRRVGELVSAGSVFSAQQLDITLRTLGFYGQQEVGWNDRLFLTGAVRYDASSTFAPSQRWQAFPKFSASYVALQNQPGLLNSVRLRSALGWAGSQPGILNAYSQFVSYTQQPFAGRPGFANDVTYGNPDLRNERAREWEVGTEVGFLGGRAGLEATYYDRLVSDLLFFRPLPTSTGFSRQFFPIGSMSNKGLELALNTTNLELPKLSWTSTITYTHNKNLVEHLDIQDFQSAGGYPNRIRAGEPAGVFYGSYAARDCITGAFLMDSLGRYRRSNQTADMGATTAAREALSHGACNDSLNAVIGDPNPKWMGSFLNEVTLFKKLKVRALLDGVFGNDIMNLSTRAQNAGVASNSKAYEQELLPYGDPRKTARRASTPERRAFSNTGSRTAHS